MLACTSKLKLLITPLEDSYVASIVDDPSFNAIILPFFSILIKDGSEAVKVVFSVISFDEPSLYIAFTIRKRSPPVRIFISSSIPIISILSNTFETSLSPNEYSLYHL